MTNTQTSTGGRRVPQFWDSINKGLDAIAELKPDTFDDVAVVLNAYGDPWHIGPHVPGVTYFGGAAGHRSLGDVLCEAGWRRTWTQGSGLYALTHPKTGESLTYTNGVVERGDHQPDPDAD